jgi:hypothetical protein
VVFGHVRSRRIKQMKAFDFLEVWQKSLGVDGLLLLLAAAARGSLAARCPLFATFPGGGRCAACSFVARWCLSPQHVLALAGCHCCCRLAARCRLLLSQVRCVLLAACSPLPTAAARPAATCRCRSLLLKIPRVTSGGPVPRFGMMSVCDS